MRSVTNSALICWDDELGIQYRICRLDYTEWEDGEYEYVFTPDYRVMDILPMVQVGGIPGLDLDLRRERYVRRNMQPVFMTERSPPRNRIGLWDELRSVGLDHYDRLEWLIRTNMIYSGDRLYVIRYEEPRSRDFEDGIRRDAVALCRDMLRALGSGAEMSVSGRKLDHEEAVAVGRMLRLVLLSDKAKNPKKPDPPCVGRKRKEIGIETLRKVKLDIDSGRYTAGEMADILGISRATLYRRLRESGLMGRSLGQPGDVLPEIVQVMPDLPGPGQLDRVELEHGLPELGAAVCDDVAQRAVGPGAPVHHQPRQGSDVIDEREVGDVLQRPGGSHPVEVGLGARCRRRHADVDIRPPQGVPVQDLREEDVVADGQPEPDPMVLRHGRAATRCELRLGVRPELCQMCLVVADGDIRGHEREAVVDPPVGREPGHADGDGPVLPLADLRYLAHGELHPHVLAVQGVTVAGEEQLREDVDVRLVPGEYLPDGSEVRLRGGGRGHLAEAYPGVHALGRGRAA